MDRVQPDMPQEFVRIVDQLIAENEQKMVQTIKNLIQQFPYAAKFYGIPKIHKAFPNRLPLRPIVSNEGMIT